MARNNMHSHREVLKFLRESNPHIKVERNRKGVYKMNFVYGKDKAARLWFTINKDKMYIQEGQTYPPYEGRGIGTFLRALATKSGKVYGSKVGRQVGVHATANPKNPKPPSTRIMERNLGWKATAVPNAIFPNRNSYIASFNYGTNNMSKTNAIIKKWYEPPKPSFFSLFKGL